VSSHTFVIIVCRIEDIGFSTLNLSTYMHVVSDIELYTTSLLPLSPCVGKPAIVCNRTCSKCGLV